ncbi:MULTISPECIES: C39 family peptidase [Rhodococcus]|uniref:C39 family peptidase n=1 Tax=Rhodococcus TaxID=1827 RepID=UPI002954528A|nr:MULTISPECIES: C39 family peptidase [Rhodococcus]MDV7246247.1 C39 family peptidase [Rhodococcus oxybenzonivorans]MDV7337281.1 C39 family peptidase [Rhodococcus oxybenzonivorans]MDV8030731.1 C39 family peptidase [Rhodococcus sp. IEGM 27]
MDDMHADLTAAAWSAGPLDDDTYLGEPVPIEEDLDAIPGPVEDDPFAVLADPAAAVDLSGIDLSALDPDLDEPPMLPPPGDEAEVDAADPVPGTEPQSPVEGAGGDGVYGDPVEWSVNWFYQQVDGYCGPSSAAQVIAEYTGVVIDDPQQLVDRALELGLMQDGDPARGMTLPNLEILLEDQGVPCTVQDSSIEDLKAKLEGGYGVIAMVDSGEIWNPDTEAGEDATADHFLVVAGIDETRGVVILSDPGAPNGNQLEVPIDQFEDAWADSGCRMLVADTPDRDLADHPDPAAMAVASPDRRWAMIDL